MPNRGSGETEVQKFLETVYSRQVEQGDHFVHEGCSLDALRESQEVTMTESGCRRYRWYSESGKYERAGTMFMTSLKTLAGPTAEFLTSPSASRRKTYACQGLKIIQVPTMMMGSIMKAMRQEVGDEYLFTVESGPIPCRDDRLWMKSQQEYFDEYWDDVNGGWLDPQKGSRGS